MNAPAVIEQNLPALQFTAEAVHAQVQLIQHVMEKVMKDGEHYGAIPGCGPKPALLKGGAEKLCLTFRLAPEFHVEQFDLANGHREVRVKCGLSSIVTGQFQGSGLGSCSTMESKFRYRSAQSPDEITDTGVPKKYWDRRKQDASPSELQAILTNEMGEPGKYGTKKVDDVWMIVKKGERTEERIENPDLADQYNTILKMATKRALVAAVLIVTAASDIFTQDIEDNPAAFGGREPEAKENVAKAEPDAKLATGGAVAPAAGSPNNAADAVNIATRDALMFKTAPKMDDGAAFEWVKNSLPGISLDDLTVLKNGCKNRGGYFWSEATKGLMEKRHLELKQPAT